MAKKKKMTFAGYNIADGWVKMEVTGQSYTTTTLEKWKALLSSGRVDEFEFPVMERRGDVLRVVYRHKPAYCLLIPKVRKTGSDIAGVPCTLKGMAYIRGGHRKPDGSVELVYQGDTDVDWNSQQELKFNGERMFTGEDDHMYTESEIVWETEESK